MNNVNCGMKNLLKSLKCIPDCMFLLWGCGEMKNAILSSSFFSSENDEERYLKPPIGTLTYWVFFLVPGQIPDEVG